MSREWLRRWVLLAVLVLTAGLALAACGGDDETAGGETEGGGETVGLGDLPAAGSETGAADTGASGGGAGAIDGGGALIVVLMPSTTNNYLAEWVKGAREEAGRLNYELKIIENNFDQAEQDVQVQQQLASGDEPVSYVWWPADNRAGIASLQALADTGIPVVQTNQLPLPEVDDIVAAYAGVNDVLNGQVSAELLMKSRDVLTASGHELASEGGNVIIISFPAGYSAGDDRIKGFEEATATAPFNVLATENAGFDAETGYNAASALIPANKDKGIDFVYATNDALAKGVIQALEENGYKPGKDVMVVGGTCHGDLSELEAAKQFGSGLQAARLEGVFSVNVVARYIASGGEVQAGDYNAPDDPDAQPEFEGAPFKRNFIPNPGVELGTDPATAVGAIDATNLWGFGFRDLCTY